MQHFELALEIERAEKIKEQADAHENVYLFTPIQDFLDWVDTIDWEEDARRALCPDFE